MVARPGFNSAADAKCLENLKKPSYIVSSVETFSTKFCSTNLPMSRTNLNRPVSPASIFRIRTWRTGRFADRVVAENRIFFPAARISATKTGNTFSRLPIFHLASGHFRSNVNPKESFSAPRKKLS